MRTRVWGGGKNVLWVWGETWVRGIKKNKLGGHEDRPSMENEKSWMLGKKGRGKQWGGRKTSTGPLRLSSLGGTQPEEVWVGGR